MNKTTTLWVMGLGVALIALASVAAAVLGPKELAVFESSAAALTLIGGAAVMIERVIEIFWTVMGGLVGTFWPLAPVTRQVRTFVAQLDESLKPFHETALTELQSIVAQKGQFSSEAQKAADEIQVLKQRFDELRKNAPDNERAQLIAAAAAQHVAYFEKKYKHLLPDLSAAAGVADLAINGLQNFLASFKDNPGRRLLSLFMGAALGLLLADALGLDMIQAALDVPREEQRFSQLNVILTGLVIGLGSSPTHEVVKAIQEYKKSLKGTNVARPDLP